MRTAHEPNGYTSVAPYLIVDGTGRTIDLLVGVFDAARPRRHPGPEGKVLHGEVRIDDTVVMFSDGAPDWPPVPSHVHVYVRDVDARYQRAPAAGATSVQAPIEKDDEDERGGGKDAGGTTWWIVARAEERG